MTGLYINASVVTENADAYTLPEEAIVLFEGTHYAFESLAGNRFRMVVINTGNTYQNKTEVVNFKELGGKNFVGSGASTLLMALKNKSED